ncbi:MAG TPA: phosphatase PAP2 family protein [Saprospiraceae bacterium]|nr:phosphatase PAP2 family protein [Saprospiraceae bacterium]HND86930.1 phosphatase PAP2 family protein [Saprospiraceae bacterium]
MNQPSAELAAPDAAIRHYGHNLWFAIPVMAALLLGGLLALRLPYGQEIVALNGWRHEPFNTLFRYATHAGEAGPYLVAGVALLVLGRYRGMALVAASGLIMLPLSFLLKDQFGMARPLTWFSEAERWHEIVTVPGVVLNSGDTSFPSGHTMSAFALYGMLTLMLPWQHRRWGLLFALLAISVGISRIFLVQHYLVDVMAGAVVGLALSGLVWYFGHMEVFRERQRSGR